MLTPLPNQNISGDIKELEDFFDRQTSTCLKSKNNEKDNDSIHVFQSGGANKISKRIHLFSAKGTGK